MAKANYEKREFTNPQTGETVKYEAYTIVSVIDGERVELRLKNLDQSEKIAWKMLMTGSDETDLSSESRKATDDEKKAFLDNIERKKDTTNLLDEEDEDRGLFS